VRFKVVLPNLSVALTDGGIVLSVRITIQIKNLILCCVLYVFETMKGSRTSPTLLRSFTSVQFKQNTIQFLCSIQLVDGFSMLQLHASVLELLKSSFLNLDITCVLYVFLAWWTHGCILCHCFLQDTSYMLEIYAFHVPSYRVGMLLPKV
jgi:hypothetical protein